MPQRYEKIPTQCGIKKGGGYTAPQLHTPLNEEIYLFFNYYFSSVISVHIHLRSMAS